MIGLKCQLDKTSQNGICQNIKQLRQPAGLAIEGEIKAAALKFMHKVSGYRKPSRANLAAFDQAVNQVALATRALLATI